MSRPQWASLLQPAPRPRVVELQGAYKPPPVPPGYFEGGARMPSGRAPQRIEVVEPFGYIQSQGTNASWGRNAENAFPATVNDRIVIVEQTQFPGPPRPITVHLHKSDVTPVTAGNAMLRAIVTYGTGGATNVAELDWIQGGQFTIVANSIRIEARAVNPFPDLPYTPDNGRVILGASFGIEPADPALPPTLTAPYQPLIAPAQIQFAIPDFARRAFPLFIDEGGGAAPFDVWRVRFGISGGTNVVDYPCNADIVQNGLVIPGFARTFSIFSATQSQSCGAMFQLGL